VLSELLNTTEPSPVLVPMEHRRATIVGRFPSIAKMQCHFVIVNAGNGDDNRGHLLQMRPYMMYAFCVFDKTFCSRSKRRRKRPVYSSSFALCVNLKYSPRSTIVVLSLRNTNYNLAKTCLCQHISTTEAA
jgi:hypothetical protein